MRTLWFAAALAVSAASVAGVNLNLDLPYQSVVRPNSGYVTVFYTGTVDVLVPSFDVIDAILEFPGNGSAYLAVNFDSAFSTYVASSAPGVDYSGALFSVDVSNSDAYGLYWLNGSSYGLSQMSELIVYASNGVIQAVDNEMYGVEVVPEPAATAALGLGLAALARRKRQA